MTIRSLTQLLDALDKELEWRKRELTTINFAVNNARRHQRGPFLRAAVCLLYAHWEGFVKTAARGYISYVAHQGLQYRHLTPNFVALGLRRKIRDAGQSNQPSIHTKLVEMLMSDLSENSNLDWRNSIDTGSNLNTKRLTEILALLGLDSTNYLSKRQLLDQKLLANRNMVAHGERVEIGADDYGLLHSEIIQLADQFNTDVQNAAATGKYRRASP